VVIWGLMSQQQKQGSSSRVALPPTGIERCPVCRSTAHIKRRSGAVWDKEASRWEPPYAECVCAECRRPLAQIPDTTLPYSELCWQLKAVRLSDGTMLDEWWVTVEVSE
jgi:hypothetical protein